ncbi:MAG: hypothetical protein F4056_01940 [Chloroflexi bacterium]|nr:hypothetical protein [Chloroflexota bacterium]
MRIERKPVIEGDEFAWGHVLSSEQRPEGTPLSLPVARMLASADGRASIAELSERIAAAAGVSDEATRARLTEQLAAAASILYVDGAIEELAGLGE